MVSTWTNDAGYLTSVPAQTWNSITGKPTAISTWTNDSGYLTAATLPAHGGDVTGSQTASTVVKIQGVAVATTAPAINQVLTYNGTNWVPSLMPWTSVSGRPTAVSAFTNDAGYLTSGSLPTLAGDVTGSSGANKVVKIQNYAVSSSAPAGDQVMMWNSTTTQWEPTSPSSSTALTPIWFVDYLTPTGGKFGTNGLLDWNGGSTMSGGGQTLTGTGTIVTSSTIYRLDVDSMDSFFIHKGSFPSSTLIMGFGRATPYTTTTNDIAVRRNSDGTYTGICLGSTATVVAGTNIGTAFRVRRSNGGNYLFSVNGGVETSITCNAGTSIFAPFYNVVHTGTSSFIFKMFALQLNDWF